MNAELVRCWNARVNKNATVIHVGDMLFGSSKRWNEILDQLNGRIILVEGNHDRENQPNATTRARFESRHSILELDVEGQLLHVCHYPMMSWRNRQRGSIMVHGHCHGTSTQSVSGPQVRRLDVGVDCSTRYGAPSYSPIAHAELLNYALSIPAA